MPKQVHPDELKRRADLLSAAMAAAIPPWTVTALAAAADVDRGHVSRILSGKKSGSGGVLASLAGVLKIPLDDLIRPRDPAAVRRVAPSSSNSAVDTAPSETPPEKEATVS